LLEHNTTLDIKKILKIWVIIICSLTPLIYLPIVGKFNSYVPRFLFLVLMFTILFCIIFLNRKQIGRLIDFDIETRLLLVFYVLLVISVFFALDKQTAIFGSLSRVEGLLTLTIYFSIFLTSRNIEKIGKKFILVMLLPGAIISIHGILQAYGIDPIPNHYYFANMLSSNLAFSTMGNPNHLGTYLVLLIPFTIYLYIEKKHIFGFIFYIIMFYALLTTSTRGSWIGLFLGLSIYFFFRIRQNRRSGIKDNKHKYIIIASIILLVVYSFSSDFNFIARFASIFLDFIKVVKRSNDVLDAGSFRLYIWDKVIELIKSRPFFGVGLDNLGIAFGKYYQLETINTMGITGLGTVSKAHNEYLHIAVTSGIPSLIIYLSLVVTIFKKIISRIIHSDIYLPLMASLVGFYTIGFFNNQVIMFAYLLWAFLGLACSKVIITYDEKGW